MRRETLPPLREDYFELDRHVHFVDLTDPTVRRVVVELLEAHGYTTRYERESIIKSFLPLAVRMDKHEFDCIGNITCAAAAATARVILDLDEFLIIYDRDIKGQE